jgi:hypothetical protein
MMMRPSRPFRAALRVGAALIALAFARSATAETGLVASGTRVELGELAPEAPEALRALDLGPAPPPGASVLFDRDRVLSQIRAAGADPSLVKLPRVLRVVGASRHWSPTELVALVRPSVEDALPRGVELKHIDAKMPLVTAPGAVAGRAEIPKLPKQVGTFHSAVVIPIIADGAVIARVTVNATFDVSESGATPDVPRGSRITLVIERRGSRVGAAGIALADTDVGSISDFRVDKTGRVVKARVDALDLANVVSP